MRGKIKKKDAREQKIFIFLKIRAHFRVRLYSDAVFYISVKYTKSPDSIPPEVQ